MGLRLMWIFNTAGFQSVVAYRPNKDLAQTEHRNLAMASEDPKGWLLVRARLKSDLEAVQQKLGTDIHILRDASADYAYRALVTKDEWKRFLAIEVDGIDYDSHFKEVSKERAPQHPDRYSAMMSVWGTMARLQDVAPYSGLYRGYGAGTGTVTGTSSYKASSKQPSAGSLAAAGVTPSSPVGGAWSDEDWEFADVDSVARTYSATSALTHPSLFTLEDAMSNLIAEAAQTVSLEDMVATLKSADSPSEVGHDVVAASTDEAFELWTRAYALSESRKLTDDEIDDLVVQIGCTDSE